MEGRTGELPRVLAEPFLQVILPTGSQLPSRTIDPMLSKDTKFPESVNKTLNHNLSTPRAKAPTLVNVNHSEHL